MMSDAGWDKVKSWYQAADYPSLKDQCSWEYNQDVERWCLSTKGRQSHLSYKEKNRVITLYNESHEDKVALLAIPDSKRLRRSIDECISKLRKENRAGDIETIVSEYRQFLRQAFLEVSSGVLFSRTGMAIRCLMLICYVSGEKPSYGSGQSIHRGL
jgi:hypothetical protein